MLFTVLRNEVTFSLNVLGCKSGFVPGREILVKKVTDTVAVEDIPEYGITEGVGISKSKLVDVDEFDNKLLMLVRVGFTPDKEECRVNCIEIFDLC